MQNTHSKQILKIYQMVTHWAFFFPKVPHKIIFKLLFRLGLLKHNRWLDFSLWKCFMTSKIIQKAIKYLLIEKLRGELTITRPSYFSLVHTFYSLRSFFLFDPFGGLLCSIFIKLVQKATVKNTEGWWKTVCSLLWSLGPRVKRLSPPKLGNTWEVHRVVLTL